VRNRDRLLREVEAIGQVVGARLGVAERAEAERGLGKLQDATELVLHV